MKIDKQSNIYISIYTIYINVSLFFSHIALLINVKLVCKHIDNNFRFELHDDIIVYVHT